MVWPKGKGKKRRGFGGAHQPYKGGQGKPEEGDSLNTGPQVDRLRSSDPKERELACLAIASLAEEGRRNDEGAMELLSNGGQVVDNLATLLADSFTVVVAAASGALRNLIIALGEGGISELCKEQNGVGAKIMRQLDWGKRKLEQPPAATASSTEQGPAEMQMQLEDKETPSERAERRRAEVGEMVVELLLLLKLILQEERIARPFCNNESLGIFTGLAALDAANSMGMKAPSLHCLLILCSGEHSFTPEGCAELEKQLDLASLSQGPILIKVLKIAIVCSLDKSKLRTFQKTLTDVLSHSNPVTTCAKFNLPKLNSTKSSSPFPNENTETLKSAETFWMHSTQAFTIACEVLSDCLVDDEDEDGGMDMDTPAAPGEMLRRLADPLLGSAEELLKGVGEVEGVLGDIRVPIGATYLDAETALTVALSNLAIGYSEGEGGKQYRQRIFVTTMQLLDRYSRKLCVERASFCQFSLQAVWTCLASGANEIDEEPTLSDLLRNSLGLFKGYAESGAQDASFDVVRAYAVRCLGLLGGILPGKTGGGHNPMDLHKEVTSFVVAQLGDRSLLVRIDAALALVDLLSHDAAVSVARQMQVPGGLASLDCEGWGKEAVIAIQTSQEWGQEAQTRLEELVDTLGDWLDWIKAQP